MVPSASRAASCAGIACMPAAGTTALPVANIRVTKAKTSLDVVSSRSKKIPAKNGRQNRSTIDVEKPSLASASRVVVGDSLHPASREGIRSACSLSPSVASGERRALSALAGRRRGSTSR